MRVKITVGTRGSQLSLIQTETVVGRLRKLFPDLEVETKVIKTTGDLEAEVPLYQIQAKGIFEKEIDRSILEGHVDFAVHSMKDVPTVQPPGITIAAVPRRESPRDVLMSREDLRLEDLPSGAVVGTSSPRRRAQVTYVRPDLRVEPVRGNVDTRVRKLKEGPYDALILAEAGLRRLGLQSYISQRLSVRDFTPAPGQGALAVVAREDDTETVRLLKQVNHPASMAETLAERALSRELEGGCQIPLGALGRVEGSTLTLYASVLSPDGRMRMEFSQSGAASSPEELGSRVAHEISRKTGDLIERWRRTL